MKLFLKTFFGGQNYFTYLIIFIEPVEVAKQKPVVKPDADVVQEKPVEKVTLKKFGKYKYWSDNSAENLFQSSFEIVDLFEMKQGLMLRCIVLTAISSPEWWKLASSGWGDRGKAF